MRRVISVDTGLVFTMVPGPHRGVLTPTALRYSTGCVLLPVSHKGPLVVALDLVLLSRSIYPFGDMSVTCMCSLPTAFSEVQSTGCDHRAREGLELGVGGCQDIGHSACFSVYLL